MKRIATVVLALVLFACQEIPGPDPTSWEPAEPEAAAQAAAGRYVVTLQEGVNPALAAAELGVTPAFVYRHALNGFVADLAAEDASRLRTDPRVSKLEPDRVVGLGPAATWAATAEAGPVAETVQPGAPTHLDRVDQRRRPLDGTYRYDGTGAGVRVHILGTGIRYTHNEFGGRATFGFDALGGDGSDCGFGHGTAMAGIVGGSTYGVAKGVTLVSVRVLDCGGSGTLAGVVAGIDWVVGQKLAQPGVPMVADLNLLTLDTSPALETAILAMIAVGVPTAVGAPAEEDSCHRSPTTLPEVLAAGGAGSFDQAVTGVGACIDLYAYAGLVATAGVGSDDDVGITSGSTAAAAQVAGVAALYLGQHPDASAQAVHDALLAASTKGIVIPQRGLTSGPPHDMLFSRLDAVDTQPPVASFTIACFGPGCAFTDTSTGDPSSWQWDLGNGITTTVPHPGIGYGVGTFAVTLTVSNSLGQDTATGSVVCTAPPDRILVTCQPGA